MYAYVFRCHAPYWGYVASGRKKFEVRAHDPKKPVVEGDTIVLHETGRDSGTETGHSLRARVTYVLKVGEVVDMYHPMLLSEGFVYNLEIWSLDEVEVRR